MSFDGFPFIIGWELTLACNLRCRHCGSAAGVPRERELTTNEALNLCDQFPALLVQEVDFTGGEPLLRPDWWQIASYLGKLGITTRILSNGLPLQPDTVSQIKDAGIAAVGISLDGLQTTHDYIRGSAGVFQKVLAGIDQVLEAGLPLAIITTVNALNLSDLPGMLDLLLSKGVNRWQLQPFACLGRGQDFPELQLSAPQYLQIGIFLEQAQAKAQKGGLDLGPADSLGYFTELDQKTPPWRGCSAGLVACGITSNGRIKGCLSLPDDLSEGDLREKDLWDIWFHPDAFAYTRRFAPEQLGPECQACEWGEQCRGGCSTISYANTGSFHNDPFCFYGIRKRSEQARLAYGT